MTRRNNRRPTNNRRRRRRKRPRTSVLPPATSISGHILRTVIQTAWDIAQGALYVPPTFAVLPGLFDNATAHRLDKLTPNPSTWTSGNMDDGWLFAQSWRDRVKHLFRQYKVHSITAHYVPYASNTAPGEYIFALWDAQENETPNSFSSALGMPASVIRKTHQPSKLVWYPTEPDDRNWHAFEDKHSWCVASIDSAEGIYHVAQPTPNTITKEYKSAANIAGKVIIEVDATFRGTPSPSLLAYEHLCNAELRARYLDAIRCRCRKCKRSQSIAAFHAEGLLTSEVVANANEPSTTE